MATADELLSGEVSIDNTFVISNDLRTITIPPTVAILGVESDDEVVRLNFKMPRYIGDIDLSDFGIRVNYINAKGEGDAYTVNDATVGAQDITFSWLVGPTATRYKGNTTFNICLVLLTEDGKYVDREFNTTVTSLPVLQGLEVDPKIVEEYSDIIEQWRREIFAKANIAPSETAVYNAEREALTVDHTVLDTTYIWGLYDALKRDYPNNVQKVDYSIGDFEQYVYVISTGEYSTNGSYATVDDRFWSADPDIKKPKYLILSGIHGTERRGVISVYRFIRDVLNNSTVSPMFKEGVSIHVMPVGNPFGLSAYTRGNAEGVDINRDFHKVGKGTAAKETQAIANWLDANKDADLFIDCHNNSATNEVAIILGSANNSVSDNVKKIALRGIDRVIPVWRTSFPDDTKVLTIVGENADKSYILEERDVIYAYTASLDYPNALAFNYANNVVGIPGIALEMTMYAGDYFDKIDSEPIYQPEALAMGSEAIGNILLEFYEQTFYQAFYKEVGENMKNVDNKLDALLASVPFNFRKVTGALTLENTINGGEQFVINGLPSNAIVIDVRADKEVPAGSQTVDNTNKTIYSHNYKDYMCFSMAPRILSGRTENADKLCCSYVQHTSTKGSQVGYGYFGTDTEFVVGEDGTGTLTHTLRPDSYETNVDGTAWTVDERNHIASHTTGGERITYNWTAYCWDSKPTTSQ